MAVKQVLKYWPIAVSLAAAVCIAFFNAPPSPYVHEHGQYIGRVESAVSRTSYTGRVSQKWRIVLEDGQSFWIAVPAAEIASSKQRVAIVVQCKTPKADQCSAKLRDLHP